MQGALFQWIRKKPQPSSLRITTADDETHIIDINASSSQRWKMALESIKAMRATTVACLDAKGKILRSRELEPEPGDASEDEIAVRSRDRAVSNNNREMAAMLAAYGRGIKEAYDAGASASGKSHEALVGLVETLTDNLNLAIVNMHTLSANFAKQIAEQAGVEPPSGNEALIAQVLAGAMSNGKPREQ